MNMDLFAKPTREVHHIFSINSLLGTVNEGRDLFREARAVLGPGALGTKKSAFQMLAGSGFRVISQVWVRWWWDKLCSMHYTTMIWTILLFTKGFQRDRWNEMMVVS